MNSKRRKNRAEENLHPSMVERGPLQRERSKGRWLLLGGGVAFLLGIVIYSLFATDLLGSNAGPEKASALGPEKAPALRPEKISALEPQKVSAEIAPDVVLATLDGEFRLSEHRGKVIVFYFSFPG